MQIQTLFQGFLDLLFPPRCVACKQVGEGLLCPDCRKQFVKVGEAVCQVCGRVVEHRSLCQFCQAERPFYDSHRSAFRFEGTLRQAIHALKYQNKRSLAPLLGRALSENIQPAADASLLCPVPLHATRQQERGYNQAELLAQELAVLWSIACVPAGTLQRIRITESQVGLDFQQRQDNVRRAFVAQSELSEGQHVVLIDDVCTTGSTLNACAQALLEAGARKVTAVTLARAVSME